MSTDALGPDHNSDLSNIAGFDRSSTLLEFDQIKLKLSSLTRTSHGRRAALGLRAATSPLEIASRLQETTEARTLIDQTGILEFGSDEDLDEWIQRVLLDGVLRGGELFSIAELIKIARVNQTNLKTRVDLPLLNNIALDIPDLMLVETPIRACISPSGEVLDGASANLYQLRQDTRIAYRQLNEIMDRGLRRGQRQGVLQEPIITQRNGRLVLLVKAERKSQVPGIVHDVSDSGATVFVEPMGAIEFGNRWREALLAEQREEERILRDLSNLVAESGSDLQLTLSLLGKLDLAIAKGRCSIEWSGIAPRMIVDQVFGRAIKLVQARHPLISQDAVPISLSLGQPLVSEPNNSEEIPIHYQDQDKSVHPNVMVITGPNAGGKTVALKTVGLFALMAHAGLHVPAQEAIFPILDGIYVDIGDQQSIEESLSTFSSHISNLKWIMERVTMKSLVLIDELGTSTDPEEGSALSEAILSHFQDVGALTIATTHHRVVAAYAQEQVGMMNASVDLDPTTLAPTYRITMGLPGRSYAMTIATRLGLATEVVDQARSLMAPSQLVAEELIQDLQKEREVLNRLNIEAEENLAEAVKQREEVEHNLANLETIKENLVEEARNELQQQTAELLNRLRRVERFIEQPTVSSLGNSDVGLDKELDVNALSVDEARLELNQVRRSINSPEWDPISVSRTGWQRDLVSGDRVYIRGIPRPVVVINPSGEDDHIEVSLGTMRAKIPIYQLEGLAPSLRSENSGLQTTGRSDNSGRAYESTVSRNSLPKISFDPEIDLRGQRVHQALDQIEDLLRHGAAQDVDEVRIIHGKGTGILRTAVREYLSDHPLVKLATPDPENSGDGVTLVFLK